jgi:hypothetical protein
MMNMPKVEKSMVLPPASFAMLSRPLITKQRCVFFVCSFDVELGPAAVCYF